MTETADLFEILHSDHEVVSSLLTAIRQGNSERRAQIFSRLKEELEVHSSAEEACVYSRLMEKTPLIKTVARSEEEHSTIREYLECLEQVAVDSKDWKEAFEDLEETIELHVKKEEGEVFSDMRKLFSVSELDQMKDDFLGTKKKLKLGEAA
jgi:hemerythrin-like domain-containing protein